MCCVWVCWFDVVIELCVGIGVLVSFVIYVLVDIIVVKFDWNIIVYVW